MYLLMQSITSFYGVMLILWIFDSFDNINVRIWSAVCKSEVDINDEHTNRLKNLYNNVK